ncbi:hypothetical protein SAY86_023364 [Trapa natans]|uniref:Uncharacterized protein n=1 Tax=Trapa natans TaxID=22666 RepID=A0AAN7LX58_TRANT|nr:hypothetical protein SAY86_023364 [Trapa natans]
MGITYYGPHHPFQERKQDHTKGIVFQTLGPGKLKFNFQCYKPHHNYINYGHLTYLGQTQYVHRGYSGYPKGKIEIDRSIDQTGRFAGSDGSAREELGRSKVRGRLWASSSSSSSLSVVERLTQEKRSSEEKKADATVAPIHEMMMAGVDTIRWQLAQERRRGAKKSNRLICSEE